MRPNQPSASSPPRLYLASRLILGGAFIYASLDKIIHPEQLALIIFNYKILPGAAVNLAALILPWVELGAGILLIRGGRWALPAAIILSGLMLIFTGAVGFNLARGLDFQCGCFSVSAEARSANVMTFIRDVILLLPAAICLRAGWRQAGPETK
ncbi:MAG: MauE/DoxX family redox-associated membrane protein [Thermodesulfobacteriota bacterium]